MGRRRGASLKRSRPHRPPRPRFVIVCEGKRTEPDYFRALKEHIGRTPLIEIKIVEGVNSPERVARRAIEERRREERKGGRYDGDQFWAVFDRDQDAHYYDAVSSCEKAGIGVARSNPCFELWLILHFQDYDNAVTSKGLQRDCERIIGGGYHHRKGKTTDFSPFMARLEEAESRAEQQFERRRRVAASDGRLPPPYTTVFRLTRAVKKAARKE
ncbi:MAG: RloB domain-containing protein [Alphaproteobacteria bacterium]|nr:MAG: RloB domain-containing protein [Alphaproteobacteria bacterium]